VAGGIILSHPGLPQPFLDNPMDDGGFGGLLPPGWGGQNVVEVRVNEYL